METTLVLNENKKEKKEIMKSESKRWASIYAAVCCLVTVNSTYDSICISGTFPFLFLIFVLFLLLKDLINLERTVDNIETKKRNYNSGSPVIDAEGNLMGLNFDRSWESTMSDFMFNPNRCRNIVVDIRYVLWVMDIYSGASHLVEEMTLIRN